MSRVESVRRVWLVIFVVCLFSAISPASASAEFAIGVARDVIHSQNTSAGTLRYDFRSVNIGTAVWWWDGSTGNTGALELAYNLALGPVDLNAGGAYLYRTNSITGKHLNFSLGAALNLGGRFRVLFTHFSNGKKLFRKNDDAPNSGWNFLGVAYLF